MAFLTKAFDTQDALLTAIEAATELADWTKDYGLPPRRDELHIWVDEEIEEWNQGPDTSGLVGRDEGYHLAVYIYARQTGASAAEIRDEIKVAAGVVADVIGSQPFLGGVVQYAQHVSGTYEGAFADDSGRVREGVLKMVIACQAHVGA